ncbi:hypothetical protein [Geothrix campi]|uniref:hypothetical protein n=1 Tax=Geothrix campi TaxID=2966450 RepID=UPI002149934A|nr:hypothetical protein [Geothrix sp. SG10]
MPDEPEEIQPEAEPKTEPTNSGLAFDVIVGVPPDLIPPAPWEAEIDAFWQNILANVSAKVETPIHNFLREETEALKARLKALL